MRLAIAVLAAAALICSPAIAKPKKKHARAYTPIAATAAGACRPACIFDMSPCDPPEFKRADGRCSSPLVGGTQMP